MERPNTIIFYGLHPPYVPTTTPHETSIGTVLRIPFNLPSIYNPLVSDISLIDGLIACSFSASGSDSKVSDVDGQPYTTLLYSNGPGYTQPRNILREAGKDSIQVKKG